MADDCYSDPLYRYREPDNRFWENVSGPGPETPYQNVAISQPEQLNRYGPSGNSILTTPISYPKVPTPHETLESSTMIFHSPTSRVQRPNEFGNSRFPDWLQGHEATANYVELYGQSSNVHSSHQLREPGKNTSKVVGAVHCESNRQEKPS